MADRLSTLQDRLSRLQKSIHDQRDGPCEMRALDKLELQRKDVLSGIIELQKLGGMYEGTPDLAYHVSIICSHIVA